MKPTRQEAERELIHWVNDNLTSLTQALEGMAERNEETAETALLDGDHKHVKVFRESALAWRRMSEELQTRWAALPDESLEA